MKGSLDSSDLEKGLIEYKEQVRLGLRVYGETVAKDFESYAKENRPWTDRTSNARQGLTGYCNDTEKGVEVCIAHTVEYGPFLEYAHEKRFAILEPTVRLKSAEVLEGLRSMFAKLMVR